MRADPGLAERARRERLDQAGQCRPDLIEARQGRQGLNLVGVHGAPIEQSAAELEGLMPLGVAHQGLGEPRRVAV